MRIAWCGPVPDDGHGTGYLSTQVLHGLVDEGHLVDAFVVGSPDQVAESLRARTGLTLVCRPPHWQWNRWYSRTPLAAFVTGQLANSRAQVELRTRLAAAHRVHPYDVLYRFSQPEAMGLRGSPGTSLPVVAHPGTYAAGELRWQRREASLTAGTEGRTRHAAVTALLAARASRQRRDLGRARLLLAMSERFADDIAADYHIPRDRFRVVPHPVDLSRFRPHPRQRADGRLRLLFVSRISVRKGVEMVVELSRRLVDLEHAVRIVVIGDRTQWSDYLHLLAGLDPRTAEYAGFGADMAALYRGADVLLQPSQFEPFALTVAEALASGVPVVASDVVGATEGVDARVCRTFGRGDMDAFERQVRQLVAELRSGAAAQLAPLSRAEAERLFAPDVVMPRIAATLAEAAGITTPAAAAEV
jgi:glycosyltransferase involved in cell wall biosynthesis